MDEEWREILAMQPKFGEHSKLVFEYVEKFGVSPLALKTKKLLRLLKEMAALFEQKRFGYQKREYDTDRAVIVEALKTVCNKHFAEPLENHNYLKRVMLTIAAREDDKQRRDRDAYLRRREQGVPREEEVRDQRSEVSNGKRISDWIRESKIVKEME